MWLLLFASERDGEIDEVMILTETGVPGDVTRAEDKAGDVLQGSPFLVARAEINDWDVECVGFSIMCPYLRRVKTETRGPIMGHHTMTAEQAQTYEMLLADAALDRGCTCLPYADWFTYQDWHAQGFQVQRGEHGIALSTRYTAEGAENEEQCLPTRTFIFCRCQVKPKGA